MIEKLINIGEGVLIGAGFAVTGWLKSQDPTLVPFDGEKFLGSMISGAVAGGILGFSNVNVDLTTYNTMITTIVAYGGLTIIIENLAKAIWRKIHRPVITLEPVETPAV